MDKSRRTTHDDPVDVHKKVLWETEEISLRGMCNELISITRLERRRRIGDEGRCCGCFWGARVTERIVTA